MNKLIAIIALCSFSILSADVNQNDLKQNSFRYNQPTTQNQNHDPSNMNDDNLKHKIKDALSSGWFSGKFENVKFELDNGVVTLKGTVDSQENKDMAEKKVLKVEGIKKVDNQITVSTSQNANSNMPSSN